MSAMEQSLRRALDAGNPAEPSFRESIYAASERALERMLAAKPLDEASAHAQRVRLAETINRVEADYYASYGDPAEPAGPLGEPEETFPEFGLDQPGDPGRDDPDREDGEREASVDGRAVDGRAVHAVAADDGLEPHDAVEAAPHPPPVEDMPAAGDSGHAAERSGFEPDAAPAGRRPRGPAPRTGRARRGALIALGLVLLALLAVGYVVYDMVLPPAGAPSATNASADAAAAPEEGWIGLFDGRQLSAIATPAGGRVEAVTAAGDRPAVRIGSAGGGAEIEVAVGAGAVAELAGQTVRVELTVGSPDGTPREFGVRCLFGGETRCGRQRFTTTQSSESFVFDMVVPAGAREAGRIALDPGIADPSKALDLYAVRVRIAAPA